MSGKNSVVARAEVAAASAEAVEAPVSDPKQDELEELILKLIAKAEKQRLQLEETERALADAIAQAGEI